MNSNATNATAHAVSLNLDYDAATDLIDAINGICFRQGIRNPRAATRRILADDRRAYRRITGEDFDRARAGEFITVCREIRNAYLEKKFPKK